MFTCPHCNNPGISIFSKLLSDKSSPASCKICEDVSYPDYPDRPVKLLLSLIFSALPLLLVLAFLYEINMIVVPIIWIIFIVLWSFYSFHSLKNAAMTPTTKEITRRYQWYSLAIVCLIFIGAVLYAIYSY